MLELYHWEPNGSALKTLICLQEKGLAFSSRYVDLLQFEHFHPHFLALNRSAQVPVLVHDGRVLTESPFISEYLDEVFPRPPLRPTSAADLWRMRVWAKFAGEVLEPAVCTLGCRAWLSPALRGRDLADTLDAAPLPERRAGWRAAAEGDYPVGLVQDSLRKIGEAAARMEARLAAHDWLVGEACSIADFELYAFSNALPELAPEIVNATATPGLLRWLQRIRRRPAVAAVLAMARTPNPSHAFAPGPEHSRWG